MFSCQAPHRIIHASLNTSMRDEGFVPSLPMTLDIPTSCRASYWLHEKPKGLEQTTHMLDYKYDA